MAAPAPDFRPEPIVFKDLATQEINHGWLSTVGVKGKGEKFSHKATIDGSPVIVSVYLSQAQKNSLINAFAKTYKGNKKSEDFKTARDAHIQAHILDSAVKLTEMWKITKESDKGDDKLKVMTCNFAKKQIEIFRDKTAGRIDLRNSPSQKNENMVVAAESPEVRLNEIFSSTFKADYSLQLLGDIRRVESPKKKKEEKKTEPRAASAAAPAAPMVEEIE